MSGLPEGTHLAYHVMNEAWYWTHRTDAPNVMVQASAEGNGGGVAWKFRLEEIELGGVAHVHLQMFDDSWAAFTQIPEFFETFSSMAPNSTLKAVIDVLKAMGAVDETERTKP